MPQRARVQARVRCFSIFAFTSSPMEDNQLMDKYLRVKASPHFPSPVKDSKALLLHPQPVIYQSIIGEGEA